MTQTFEAWNMDVLRLLKKELETKKNWYTILLKIFQILEFALGKLKLLVKNKDLLSV